MPTLWILLVLTGCGRLGFDPIDPAGTSSDALAGDVFVAPNCTLGAFSSDFATGIPTWMDITQAPGSTVVGENAALSLRPPANAMGYAVADTQTAINFTNRRILIEVVQVINASQPVEMYIAMLINGGATKVFVNLNGAGQLEGVLRTPTSNDFMETPFVAAQHRYWQIRETAGELFGEASPDGMTWTMFARCTTPAGFNSASLELASGAYGSSPTPGFAVFDNLQDCL